LNDDDDDDDDTGCLAAIDMACGLFPFSSREIALFHFR